MAATVDVVLEVGAVGGLPTLVGLLVHARMRNRKLSADAGQVNTATAMELLNPLRDRVKELQAECDDLRSQVAELTAEVEHQRQVVNQTTSKLEIANKRADYYQRAFDERAGN